MLRSVCTAIFITRYIMSHKEDACSNAFLSEGGQLRVGTRSHFNWMGNEVLIVSKVLVP
jgi:hypothetical protein